jgi:LAO/AO transport system kinase
MLVMGMSLAGTGGWNPPVVPTSSAKGEGFEQLIDYLDRHGRYMRESDAGRKRTRRIAEFRMLKTAEDLLHQRFLAARQGALADVSERLAERRISPYQAAEQLLDGLNLQDHLDDKR